MWSDKPEYQLEINGPVEVVTTFWDGLVQTSCYLLLSLPPILYVSLPIDQLMNLDPITYGAKRFVLAVRPWDRINRLRKAHLRKRPMNIRRSKFGREEGECHDRRQTIKQEEE